jgi:hypothetical protein
MPARRIQVVDGDAVRSRTGKLTMGLLHGYQLGKQLNFISSFANSLVTVENIFLVLSRARSQQSFEYSGERRGLNLRIILIENLSET